MFNSIARNLVSRTTRCLANTTTTSFYATQSKNRERKRFYQNVLLAKCDSSNLYEIHLDKRRLKTPSGSVVQIRDGLLAHALAFEWQSQQEFIKLNTMHLTSLYNTCADNPNKITKEALVTQLSEYLQTDTLLYFDSNSIEKLDRLQETKWRPVVDWFNLKFPSVNLKVNYGLEVNNSEADTRVFKEYLESNFGMNSLVAFNYISECLKSVILTVALLERFVGGVDEACKLACLEQEHQYEQWGKVEWFHDINEQELRARVSAALMFIYLSHDSKYYLIKE